MELNLKSRGKWIRTLITYQPLPLLQINWTVWGGRVRQVIFVEIVFLFRKFEMGNHIQTLVLPHCRNVHIPSYFVTIVFAVVKY